MSKIRVIIGTDTGVGKTLCSLLMMNHFEKAHYVKPFQTGCRDPFDEESDALFLQKHLPSHRVDPIKSTYFCFKTPKAPYFAAQNEGVELSSYHLAEVKERLKEDSQRYESLIVESAGGLLVPITKDHLFIDLLKEWGEVETFLVARPSLGTINHTLLSLHLLKEKKIFVRGVIFAHAPHLQATEEEIEENKRAISHFSKVAVLGVIPPLTDFSHLDQGIGDVLFKEIL